MDTDKEKSALDFKVYNLRFYNALKRRSQDEPPIWFMRQAGRYHSHYQELKKKHSFVELCKNPELAAEVALGPIRDFDFDVAILFSDILFPLEAMGLGLSYSPGPVFDEKMDDKKIKQIKPVIEMERELDFQRKALHYTRELLPSTKSLIGFIGGPWTLFSYAMKDECKKSFLKGESRGKDLFNDFFRSLTPLLLKNIELQIKGGAEVVMIFDSSVSEISNTDEILFLEFLFPHLKKLSLFYPSRLAYYSKGLSKNLLEKIASLPWAGLGFDDQWREGFFPPVKSPGFFQGNFSPSLMTEEFSRFEKFFSQYLNYWVRKTKEERLGWVLSLGHGVLPKTPEKNVRAFVEMARNVFSKPNLI